MRMLPAVALLLLAACGRVVPQPAASTPVAPVAANAVMAGVALGPALAGLALADADALRRRSLTRGVEDGLDRLARQRGVGVPALVAFELRGVLLGGALRHLVDERDRHLGDVQRHRQCEGQADQQADDEAEREAALLGLGGAHAGVSSVSRFMERGALTPSTRRPLRSTCRVAASSARRARASSASSTRKRSAA